LEYVIYSRYSREKLMHHNSCHVIRRIKKANRIPMDLEEATKKGLHFCKHCSRMLNRYYKEKNEIDKFCRANGIIISIYDDVTMQVISRKDCWRIIIDTTTNNNAIFLYHKNSRRHLKNKKKENVEGFHKQKETSRSIMGYLRYIKEHDDFRDEHPCTEVKTKEAEKKHKKGSKSYKRKMATKKNNERAASIIRVRALIEELAVMEGK